MHINGSKIIQEAKRKGAPVRSIVDDEVMAQIEPEAAEAAIASEGTQSAPEPEEDAKGKGKRGQRKKKDAMVGAVDGIITEDDVEAIRRKRAIARAKRKATVADAEGGSVDDMFRSTPDPFKASEIASIYESGSSAAIARKMADGKGAFSRAAVKMRAEGKSAPIIYASEFEENVLRPGDEATANTESPSSAERSAFSQRETKSTLSDRLGDIASDAPTTVEVGDMPSDAARQRARDAARAREEMYESLREAGIDEDDFEQMEDILAETYGAGIAADGSFDVDKIRSAISKAMMDSAKGDKRALRRAAKEAKKAAKAARKQEKRDLKAAKKAAKKGKSSGPGANRQGSSVSREEQVSSIYGPKTKTERRAERKRTRRARGPKLFGVPLWQWFTLLLGLALLAYPIIADRVSAYQADQAIMSYTEQLTQDPVEINRLLDEAKAYNDRIGGVPNDSGAAVIPQDQLIVSGQLPFAWIEFPTLSEKLPIYHGTSSATLQAGVGNLEKTSIPIGGNSTHSVLTGHSGMPGSRMFDDIDRLDIGDVFMIHVLNLDLAYKVISTEVVWPDEVDSLSVQPGRDLVTLITCTPYGVNDHRLLVHAERTDYDEALELPSNNMALFFNRRTIPFIIAIAMMIVFFFGVSVHRKLRYPLELGVDAAWNGLSDYTDDKRRYVGKRRL